MTGLVGYVGLGFRHIADFAAMDHLLFLVALVAPYRVRDWRHLLLVASAFTVGHSLTLALAVTDVVRLPTALIEFLIPVTIILAAAG
ncbi:MAG TPA: HupE/UreJ family protein, partial [Gemmatimonadales bacterium]